MKRIILTSIIALVSLHSAMAQLVIDAQLRPRGEYLHGFRTLADSVSQEGAAFVDQRTRLNFGYTHRLVKAYVSIQDIRTWGSTPQANRHDGFIHLNQAWAETMFGKGFSAKFGRQQIDYDDARIFGNLEWAQQSRSHDAFLLKYEDSTLSVHVGAAYNQENPPKFFFTNYDLAGNYKTMQYLWAHKDFKHKVGLSVLFLNNGMQLFDTDSVGERSNYRTAFSQTAGGRLTWDSKFLWLGSNFYYQFGRAGNDRTLNAFNALLEMEAKPIGKLGILVGYEVMSGTGQVQQTTDNHSFTPFYGTNHKFNGFMDYFYVGNHANNVGLHDVYLKLRKKGRLFISLDAHIFHAYADLLDSQWLADMGERRAMTPYLGLELDLTGRYKVNEMVTVQGGYSHLFASRSMEELKGGSRNALNHWAYLMITVTPVLFNSENHVRKEKQ